MTLHKLQDNGGGDDGAIGITEALVSSLTLRWVYLDGNSITDQGGKVSPATVGTLCYCYCLLLTAYCILLHYDSTETDHCHSAASQLQSQSF